MKVYVFKVFIVLLLLIPIRLVKAQVIAVKQPKLPFSEMVLAFYDADGIKSLKTKTSDESGFALFMSDSLVSGLYYVVFSDSSSVEFMIDTDFPEKTTVSFDDNSNTYSVSGSPVTNAYADFLLNLQILSNQGKDNIINSFYYQGSNDAKSKINALIDKYSSQFPKSILSSYLSALKNIEIPVFETNHDAVTKDSASWSYQLLYFQKHYLDNISLSDIRLTRTPVYKDLVNKYLSQIVRQNPADLTDGVDLLVRKSSLNTDTREYMTRMLFNKYRLKRYTSLGEYLLLHIIEEYIFNSGNTWVTDSELLTITKEYNILKPASILQPAPELTWKDENGSNWKLDQIQSEFIVLYFYSYDCPVCSKATPDLRKIMSKYNYLNGKVVAICMGNNAEEWKKYIEKNNPKSWMNGLVESIPYNELRKYNLTLTPTLFVLDASKIIILKNITVAELDKHLLKVAISGGK